MRVASRRVLLGRPARVVSVWRSTSLGTSSASCLADFRLRPLGVRMTAGKVYLYKPEVMMILIVRELLLANVSIRYWAGVGGQKP